MFQPGLVRHRFVGSSVSQIYLEDSITSLFHFLKDLRRETGHKYVSTPGHFPPSLLPSSAQIVVGKDPFRLIVYLNH
jgi:hypothetical protein